MIQELLGGLVEERKMSLPSSQSHLSSPSSSPASSTTTTDQQQSHQQNLRCPRCDSANTKFCYYNNYNLTQPRHFCKTCRRYWTKGGALRNVPIGGGCRKTKTLPTITTKSPSTIKFAKPDLLARSGLVGRFDADHLPSAALNWVSSPHTSHLMALLRSTTAVQNPNSCLNPGISLNSVRVKEDPGAFLSSNLVGASDGFDHLAQLPGFSVGSLWKSSGQYSSNENLCVSELPRLGIHGEQYQRFRAQDNNCYNDQHFQGLVNGNNIGPGDHSIGNCSSSATAISTATTSTSTSVMEALPLSSADFAYWNPALAWPDLSTANGAFP